MRLEDLKKNPKEVRKQAMEIIARKAIQTGACKCEVPEERCQATAKGQRDRRRGSKGKRRQREEQRGTEI